MSLETKLNDSLNDVLRSAGYITEIINNNRKQSNLVTGSNSQLIIPAITQQLQNSILRFDTILEDTIGKFNDAKWCLEQMIESKQKQEEIKHKEEVERQKKEEAERKRKEDEERKRLEDEGRKREEEKKKLDDSKPKDEPDTLNDFMSPSFDFNPSKLPDDPGMALDIPNPSDILSSINYTDKTEPTTAKSGEDLDLNNLLGNDELILDGLNMSLLDLGGLDAGQDNDLNEEEFDVDNFLNQFGGGD